MTTRAGARIRPFRWFLALAVTVSTLAGLLGDPVSAAAHRAAQATPAVGLGDQVVKVTWEGFTPTHGDGTFAVVIMQCRAHPKSVANDCNTGETFPYSLTGNQQSGVTSSDGTGSVYMDIMTTARLPSLVCSQTSPCSLLLYEVTASGFNPNRLPADRVLVPLRFARNSADCPPVKQFDVRMETEASAAPALYQWAAHFCTGPHAFTVDVTNTSSNSAREDFFNKTVDIAVTSTPPQPGEATRKSPKYSVVPLDLTAVVLAYNITDSVTDKPITDLTLTPRLVARLLSDSDVGNFFTDPEFLALNPHHAWPIQMADPGLRAEQNADTWIVTNWVSGSHEARKFLNGNDPYDVPVNPSWLHVKYPTDVFAARDPNGVYFPRIGEEGVAQRLFADTKPADSVPTDPVDDGFIAVLDLPTAERYELPIAKLTSGIGQPAVSPNWLGLAAGYNAMTISPDGFDTEPATLPDPNAYPLTKVDHAMVPPRLHKSAKDLRIRALLDYAVGHGQGALPPGYAVLPPALRFQTLSYTGDLPPTPTTTTTTRVIESPNPIDSGGFGSNYGSSPTSTTRATTPLTTAKKRATTTTTTTQPRSRLVALRLPVSQDQLALPVVLVLAAIAALASGADVVRRRVRPWRRRAVRGASGR